MDQTGAMLLISLGPCDIFSIFGPPQPFLGPLAAILDFKASDWSKYKECSNQETYLAKVAGNGPIGLDPFPDPIGHFGAP